MSSAEALRQTLADHAAALFALARASIRAGLATGRPLDVATEDCHPELRRKAASFVTLHIGGELRGCIGSVEPHLTLAEDVARNAYLSAFEDPRFTPVTVVEAARLDVEISVLGDPEPVSFADEGDLLARLRPGDDGLIIEAGGRRGVFLPQVWESLPAPADFVAQLKAKAGMGAAPLSPDARAQRFSVVKLVDAPASA